MSLSADLDRARLSVLLDLRHPLAYLALNPAIAFAQSQGIAINWLPLVTPTLKPPSAPAPGDDRGVRHRRYRGEAIAREVDAYARAQGLHLRELYRSDDPEAANLGWLWLRDRHPERLESFLVELFRAYWAARLHASDAQQVAARVDSICGDGGAFLAWAVSSGGSAAAALADELRERGIFQVPAYVIEDEVFYGRQHLPMIRWILGGRSGPVPI